MKLSALDHIACLHCLSKLNLNPEFSRDPDHQEEIYEGTLTCSNESCRKQFRLSGGVPRMVDEGTSSATDIRTGKSFAAEWKRFARMDERYKQQFYDWIAPVEEPFLKDKLVLECGCGKGRHAKIIHESGARAVFAVDIGEAIDVAYKNVGHLANVNLVQADIEHLPFRSDFDFAFSVGVLHHMDSPVNGFLAMSRKLKPNGSVLAWVYGRENNWWLIRIVNPFRTKITSRLHPSLLMILSAAISLPLMIFCKAIAQPWKALRSRAPWVPPLFYQDYLSYIAQFDFNEFHHIVFDHLVAPVANYVSRDYFRKWFSEGGFPGEPIIRWHNRNSWTGFSSFDDGILEEMRLKCAAGSAASSQAGSGPAGTAQTSSAQPGSAHSVPVDRPPGGAQ